MSTTVTLPSGPVAAVVLGLSLGSTVTTEDGTLMVCHRSFPLGADETAVLTGRVSAESAVLTADGRGFLAGWHTGPEADWVRVERWTADGRVFHGWVDSVSRKLLQAG